MEKVRKMNIPKRRGTARWMLIVLLYALFWGSANNGAQAAIVRDAQMVELEKSFNDTQAELKKLTGQLQAMTQPGKPMAERKKYAEQILRLRRRLLSLKRRIERRPKSVFRLVKVLGPASSGGDHVGSSILFRNPEPGYSAKKVRTFGDGNGTWTVTRNLSIGFRLLPKEFIAGHPFGFQIEAKLRDSYPRAYVCFKRREKYSVLLGLRAFVGMLTDVDVRSNMSADSDCGPSAICKTFGGREVCRLGYIDRDSHVMLRLRYVPLSSKVGTDSATRFRYRVDTFTDGKRANEGQKPLTSSVSVHWENFAEQPEPDVFRIKVKFSGITDLREMPDLTLVYQTVRGNAPYIRKIPPYHHPGIFRQRPRRNSGMSATVPKILGLTRSQARNAAHKSGFKIRFEGGGSPSSRDDLETVQSQNLPPGSESPWGGTIVVTMRRYVQTVPVPNLKGLSARAAQARLQEVGLNYSFVTGRAAPSEQYSGTVESHNPSAGARIRRRERVVVRIFGAYQDARCYGIEENLRTVRNDVDRLHLLRDAKSLSCRIPNLERELSRVERSENQRRMCDNLIRTADFARGNDGKLIPLRQARAMGCRNPGLSSRIAALEREIQHDRQCSNLIRTANMPRSPESRLQILRQARGSRCQAPGLNNAIASLEREIRRRQQCTALLRNAQSARSDVQKLNLYRRAKQNGCQASGLDRTIASLESAVRHQRMCDDLIARGNRATSAYTKLSLFRNAKNRGCRARGLDSTIASLDRQVKKEQRCNQLLGSSARERNQQRRLGLLKQAKREGCSSPGLNSAISSLERSTRPPARTPAPAPKSNPNLGVLLPPGKGDNTRVCDCYDKQNGYYASFLGFCNAGAAVKPCIKVKGRTPGY